MLTGKQNWPCCVPPSQPLEPRVNPGFKGSMALVMDADSDLSLALAWVLLDKSVWAFIRNQAADSIAKAAQEIAARGEAHSVPTEVA